MIGKTVAHYKIVEKIGEGGMGVVYKAEDTKLKRTVALKFLPAEMTRDAQAKKRFLQEAQAAAALDHPNICTIHEINEAEGQTYISMAYVEGKSLKEKLAAGPLAISEALDIAAQVAEGLKRAHDKGIIHRDIKPGNIMLAEDGRAKIMDFGLAKLTSGSDITKTLTVMGTIAYMSPEQARGEAVDHRTDIWSFGTMLYEMVTGQTPFAKRKDEAMLGPAFPDMPAMLHSILYDPVEPPSRLRKDLPRPVEQIILKALDKDRNRRYQSMDEVIKDLKAARSPEIVFPKPEKSIVVLPFEDMSPGKDNEYFSDGLTEEIIADLSKIHSLRVISRTSAMMLKSTKKDIQTIARELNVQYVLEGSVRKAGNNLRITAQLIDAPNDAHLWAEKYSGTLDDVFEIQEKVSRSIVKELNLRLTPEESSEISERPIENITAYDCYLRARQAILHLSEEGLERALQLIQTGINIIGENEILNAILGYVYVQFVNVGVSIDENILQRAEDSVSRAFSLNQDSSLAHSVMGQIHWKRGEIQEAVRDLKRALEIDPNSTEALLWLAWIYQFSGKVAVAKPLLEKLVKIDPLTPATYHILACCDLISGRFEASLQNIYRPVQMEPKNPLFNFVYAWALAAVQRLDEAFKVFDFMARDLPQEIFTELALFYKYALQENRTKPAQPVSDKLRTYAARDETIPIFLAGCYALLNEKDEAIQWIEHGVRWGFINYPFLNEHNPFLANIRGEPCFQKLMERVKCEWEHFEA